MTARYTCADCGHPTDNYSLICDECAPEYEDVPADQDAMMEAA